MWLNATGEDAAVILARFHHDGEVSELGGAVVNVKAVEVVFQDLLGGVALADAAGFVDLNEDIKGIDKNMTTIKVIDPCMGLSPL